MARPDVPPMNDDHLPPPDTATVAELRDAVGIRHQAGSRTRSERRQTTLTARELRAIELTAAGATYSQIATILSMTPTSARQLVERALERRALEVRHREAPAAKALHMERLEGLFRRWYPLAMGRPQDGVPPNERAAGILLSILDREARLLGLEAPLRAELEVGGTITHAEAVQRQERILAGLAEAHVRQLSIEGEFREDPA